MFGAADLTHKYGKPPHMLRSSTMMTMRRAVLVFVIFAAIAALGQAAPVIQTEQIPDGGVGEPFELQLSGAGRARPLHWELAKGALPEGLRLDVLTGRITGVPTAAGEAKFTLRLVDSALPPSTAEREFKLRIRAALEIRWEQEPAVVSGEIHGSVIVTNGLKDPYDLTLIIVGVNEVGKAFALGYQHWKIAPRSEMRTIKFGEGDQLPRGNYVIHVDAVGEDTVHNKIYRSRLQTPRPLAVP